MGLSVEGLRAHYGSVQVLWDVDLMVGEAEVVALIGPNGAGKTTTLRAISGLVTAAGRILFEGEDITRLSPDNRVKRGIVQVPEARQLFPGLTVAENLKLGAYTRWSDVDLDSEIGRILDFFPELSRLTRKPAGNLSGGEQQMLAIGRALMAGPRLLMIDELSWGLAPVIVERLTALVAKIQQESNLAVLLVEQDVALALEMSDRGYLLERGRVVMEGAASALLDDPEIQRAYLGVGS